MGIESKGFNNFDNTYKDVDYSSFENDSQSYDRQRLELIDRFDQRMQSEYEMFLREFDIANTYDDEIYRRTKITQINDDVSKRMTNLARQFEKELMEIKEKCEKKTEYPFYYKWRFIGETKAYDRLLNGLSYYIKQLDENKIQVFHDVKFTTYLGEFDYKDSDWKEEV